MMALHTIYETVLSTSRGAVHRPGLASCVGPRLHTSSTKVKTLRCHTSIFPGFPYLLLESGQLVYGLGIIPRSRRLISWYMHFLMLKMLLTDRLS
jgi:hypothetical protein